MNSQSKRYYRKNLKLQGVIFMDEKEQAVTIKNLSLTGVLARLNHNLYGDDLKSVFNIMSASTIIDLYIPDFKMAGEAGIVRVDMTEDDHIELALEFKNVDYYVDKWQYHRKAYRKNLAGVGRILLNDTYYEFVSVNASFDGLMIRLAEPLDIKEGTIAVFEFNQLGLKGEVKVIWADVLVESAATYLGVAYLNVSKDDIHGVPHFF